MVAAKRPLSPESPLLLSKAELAAFLNVDRRTVGEIASRLGLRPVKGTRYGWDQVMAAVGMASDTPPADARRPLLTTQDVALCLGVSEATVRRWRGESGSGFPLAVDLGPRLARFRRCDLEAWAKGRGLSVVKDRRPQTLEASPRPVLPADVARPRTGPCNDILGQILSHKNT